MDPHRPLNQLGEKIGYFLKRSAVVPFCILAAFPETVGVNFLPALRDKRKFIEETLLLANVEFTERDEVGQVEPGFEEILGTPDLRGDATPEDLEFLRNLRFRRRRPTAMFYYQELRNLRDPLHFRDGSLLRLHKRGDANSAEKQKQLDSRKTAIRRWTKNQGNFGKKNKKNK